MRFLVSFAILAVATHLVRAECAPLEAAEQEREIANLTGHAVLYPLDEARHREITRCFFALYEHPTHSLASLSWNVTHALLRIAAADPARFFEVMSQVPPSQRRAWREAFAYAALWPQGMCPQPDPFALARLAALQVRLSGEPAREQAATVRALAKVRCTVPQ